MMAARLLVAALLLVATALTFSLEHDGEAAVPQRLQSLRIQSLCMVCPTCNPCKGNIKMNINLTPISDAAAKGSKSNPSVSSSSSKSTAPTASAASNNAAQGSAAASASQSKSVTIVPPTKEPLKAETLVVQEMQPAKKGAGYNPVFDKKISKLERDVEVIKRQLSVFHKLAGPRGRRGPRGVPGAEGISRVGAPGTPGRNGRDGLPGRRGPKGSPGSPGPIGLRGDRGIAGPPGPAGRNGSNGKPGQRGQQGNPGSPGPRGAPGERGKVGPRGAVGAKGARGFPGKAGPQGKIGPLGPQGLPGPQGKQGVAGPPGKVYMSKKDLEAVKDLKRANADEIKALAAMQKRMDTMSGEIIVMRNRNKDRFAKAELATSSRFASTSSRIAKLAAQLRQSKADFAKFRDSADKRIKTLMDANKKRFSAINADIEDVNSRLDKIEKKVGDDKCCEQPSICGLPAGLVC